MMTDDNRSPVAGGFYKQMNGYRSVSSIGRSVERTAEIINIFQAAEILAKHEAKGGCAAAPATVADKEAAREIRNPL